jgi:ATP-binding cassette subfamily B protein
MGAPESRLGRAWRYVAPHRRVVLTVLGLTLVAGVLTALEPLVLKAVFDALGGRRVIAGVGLLLGVAVTREILSALSNWLTWRTRIGVHHTLLEATVSRLHELPAAFHRTEGVGALMTRLERGIQGVVAALNEVVFHLLPAVVYLLVAVVVMLRLEWRLALLVLVFAPVPAVMAAWVAPVQVQREKRLLKRWTRIYGRFNEVLSGLITVKSFAMEEKERLRFLGDVGGANQEVIAGVRFDSGVSAGQNLVMSVARVSAIAAGGYLVYRGQITTGTLVAFLGYVAGLFQPVQGLTSVYRTLRTASVAADSIFEILDAPDAVPDAPDARALDAVRGEVVFEAVRFAHAGSTLPALDGIDLRVAPGEMLAIVGPSGAGKTTLMSLLMRLHDPDHGRVLVDGVDLRGIKQRSLRHHIGVVLQEALLFNESVRENISYGRPGASLAEIEAAAAAANADGFIRQLPEGYDTVLGERGGRLSAGERQRLAIARALLKDPRILILDEATSALDAETELLVQGAVERLVAGRTTFLIAHRLSTVVRANRIVVLRGGRIVESGSHRELMALRGYYAELVRKQTHGLLDGVA